MPKFIKERRDDKGKALLFHLKIPFDGDLEKAQVHLQALHLQFTSQTFKKVQTLRGQAKPSRTSTTYARCSRTFHEKAPIIFEVQT